MVLWGSAARIRMYIYRLQIICYPAQLISHPLHFSHTLFSLQQKPLPSVTVLGCHQVTGNFSYSEKQMLARSGLWGNAGLIFKQHICPCWTFKHVKPVLCYLCQDILRHSIGFHALDKTTWEKLRTQDIRMIRTLDSVSDTPQAKLIGGIFQEATYFKQCAKKWKHDKQAGVHAKLKS